MCLTLNNYLSVPSRALGAHILELPYEGDQVSMYILLPNQKTSTVDSVLQSLDNRNLDRVIRIMKRTTINVAIPKFKLSTQLDDRLKEVCVMKTDIYVFCLIHFILKNN